MAADKKGKEIKSIVEAILAQKGISYEDWLYERHLECLAENSDAVLQAFKQTKQ